MITIFPSYKEMTPHYISLDAVASRIRVGTSKTRALVADIRNEPDKNKRRELKERLPNIMFSGQFNHRSKAGLLEHSGLIVLDFDDVDDLQELKDTVSGLPWVVMAFVSPSGNGLKAVARISKSKELHEQYFDGLRAHFSSMGVGVDKSGRDWSRICFDSIDPDLYYNPDAAMVDLQHLSKEPEKPKTNPQRSHGQRDTWAFQQVTKIISYSRDGERHNDRLRAGKLAGGYIAAGRMDEYEILQFVEADLRSRNSDEKVIEKEMKTFRDAMATGMNMPLEERRQYDREQRKAQRKIEHKVELESSAKKAAFGPKDIEDEILTLQKIGQQRGDDFHFTELSDHYTVKAGATTYIYGPPYSGKSYFWFELLLQLSEKHGHKHCIFTPETGRAAEVYAELISMCARSDFYNDFGKAMPQAQTQKWIDWLDNYFVVIDLNDELVTPDQLFDMVDSIEQVRKVKFNTVTIDPWNDLFHDFGGFGQRQDIYLEYELTKIRKNAKEHNRHNALITHASAQEKRKSKEGIWFYPPATYRELSGGQAWSRKGMAMISLWRPPDGMMDPDTGYPFSKQQLRVYFQKSKPKGIGKNGYIDLFYHAATHRFYEREKFPGESDDLEKVKKKLLSEQENQYLDNLSDSSKDFKDTDELPF